MYAQREKPLARNIKLFALHFASVGDLTIEPYKLLKEYRQVEHLQQSPLQKARHSYSKVRFLFKVS